MRKFLLAFTSLTLLSTGVLADGGMDDAREEAARRAERSSSSSLNPFSYRSWEERAIDASGTHWIAPSEATQAIETTLAPRIDPLSGYNPQVSLG